MSSEPHFASRRDLRKAVIRLRLELHRQQLQHESLLITQPLRRVRGASYSVKESLRAGNAPVWGMAGASLLSFVLNRRRGVFGLVRLGTSLLPLIRMVRRKPVPASRYPVGTPPPL
ncbi:hypothetical protein [Pseudomonas mangiferae]|uniref:YqjK-like protein n=1 Tax=Pseudomonas mangiferae TaxID=2593654 RepID=A0A553H221_9PSED|nr:hypothetical protein [Pseudomonas mangiferae]TRX75791.1 hypothetical protein FM069_04970 [Pseudomonas mangiferae]